MNARMNPDKYEKVIAVCPKPNKIKIVIERTLTIFNSMLKIKERVIIFS
jgi:hypothetical protein